MARKKTIKELDDAPIVINAQAEEHKAETLMKLMKQYAVSNLEYEGIKLTMDPQGYMPYPNQEPRTTKEPKEEDEDISVDELLYHSTSRN